MMTCSASYKKPSSLRKVARSAAARRMKWRATRQRYGNILIDCLLRFFDSWAIFAVALEFIHCFATSSAPAGHLPHRGRL